MIAGRRYWILIWYGILLVGLVGTLASVILGRKNRWKHLDEVYRALGTVAISAGMLLLLQELEGWAGHVLLLTALLLFAAAFRTAHRRGRSGD